MNESIVKRNKLIFVINNWVIFKFQAPYMKEKIKLLLRKKLKRYDNMNTVNICLGFSFYQP